MTPDATSTIGAGYAAIGRADPVLHELIVQHGTPDPFQFPDGGRTTGSNFAGMVFHIVLQQISINVALVLYDRLVAAIHGTPAPVTVLALNVDQLRKLGLSHSKASYLHNLAKQVQSGILPIDSLSTFTDAEAADLLTHVKGIGPWSAEMFLIHQLKREDILPAGDLGIRSAVQRAYALKQLPSIDETRQRGAAWMPYRTLAAALLWRSLSS